MRLNILVILNLLYLLAVQAIYAQDTPSPQDAELTQMRQKLRDFAGQVQDAQNQVVTLQAQVNQDATDKQALQAKLDALTAQLKSVSDQAAADKTDSTQKLTDLQAKADDQAGQITRLNSTVKDDKAALDQSTQLAALNEAARKQYALQAALLQRTVDDRETKNLALFKLANEILTRYEKFGLGEALEAKEPFVGVSRVKLQTLVQDYKDKILDQAATSGSLPATALQPVAPAPTAPAAVPVGTNTASTRTNN